MEGCGGSVQLPPPDEHITNDAALEVVSSLRCVSVDLGAALGANAMATAGVATGRCVSLPPALPLSDRHAEA